MVEIASEIDPVAHHKQKIVLVLSAMSDYCKGCRYSPAVKIGEGACPFNYLYWNFLLQNRRHLQANQRLQMMYRAFDEMPADRRAQILHQAQSFLNAL